MPRFAILAHDHPVPHWDLFLEDCAVLRSWRLFGVLMPGVAVPAEATPEHRLLYLDYEGFVSEGRGQVTRVDAGTFDWETQSPEIMPMRIFGQRFQGRLTLVKHSVGWSCQFDPI